MATGQVAAVAQRADAEAGFAGDGGAHLHRLHAGVLQPCDQAFVQQRIAGDDRILVIAGSVDVFGHNATEHTVTQWLDDIAAFHDRGHGQAIHGLAVVFGDDHVLGHVHQTAGQVTGVGGLQCGIGQALARAVGRVEVLLHVEALAEVRDDRGLDDGAVRLGHQAAHAGQLADLGRRTTRAGIGHDVERVHRLLVDLPAFGVGHLLGADALHHRRGDLFVGARPDVHNLVVTLAGGHQAGGVLLLDFQHFGFGCGQDVLLFVRDQHVVDTDRHAGTGGVAEAGVHQLVGEDHRLLEAQDAVALVDQAADGLLLQLGVDQLERQAFGQDLGQQRAPDRGVHDRVHVDQLAVFILFGVRDAHLDRGMQFDHAVVVGALHLGQVGEHHALALLVDELAGHVIQAQHHVLRWHDDRLAVGRRQDVVGGHHQRARFQLGFQ